MGPGTRTRSRIAWLLAIGVVLISGCAAPGTPNTNSNRGPGMMGGGPTSYSSEGQRIFLAGAGTDGLEIPRSAPRVSQGALMMGGGGCASCHAPDGRGGTIRMMTGAAIEAPDITYPELIKEGFTDATIRSAIRDGIDETGKPLEGAMPRWQMNEADLNATVTYLKVLGAQ